MTETRDNILQLKRTIDKRPLKPILPFDVFEVTLITDVSSYTDYMVKVPMYNLGPDKQNIKA